jgi:hypothetical protein
MLPAQLDEKARSPEVSRSFSRLGITSLLCGSLAILLVTIGYLQLLALLVSLAGLVLGSLGIAAFLRKREGLVLPAAGLAVTLPAFSLALFGTVWGSGEETSENRQKLIPLRNQIRADFRGGRSQAEPGTEMIWVDASKDAVQQGDVRVRVVSAGVQSVEVKESSGKKRLGEKCLVIKLRISNAGAGQLIQYSGWDQAASDDPGNTPVVHDSNGKIYAWKVFDPGHEMVGHVSKWSIAPGKWVDDILVFEAVPGGDGLKSVPLEFLRLELPCQAFQEEGTIHLQIPGRMISFRAR